MSLVISLFMDCLLFNKTICIKLSLNKAKRDESLSHFKNGKYSLNENILLEHKYIS